MLVFKAHPKPVYSLAFTPDGELVTSASDAITVWDLSATPKAVQSFESDWRCGVAGSPCGRYLAASGGRAWVLDREANKRIAPDVASTMTLAFSPDGQEIAASGLRPRQWALPSGKLVRTHDPPNNPRGDRFATGTLVYSPDGETIALSFAVLNFGVNRYDSHVFLFDRATGEQVGDLNVAFKYAHPRMLAFSPDGSAIAGNFGPALGVLSVEDGTIVAWIQPGTKHITGLAFTPDGSKLVTVSNDERVRVYDTRAWTETTGYEWQVGKLGCVVVAPDGLRMAAGSGTGKVVVWDVDPG